MHKPAMSRGLRIRDKEIPEEKPEGYASRKSSK